MTDVEKKDATVVSADVPVEARSLSDDGATAPAHDIDTSGVDEKKLLRKIDLQLIPWLSLLYLLSFLDRTSIGKCVCESARC